MKAAMKVRKLRRVGRLSARAHLSLLKELQPFRFLRQRQFPLSDFRPKVLVYQSTENFILKTAESPFELRQVLKLRHDIFFRELQNRDLETQLDVDEFDSICDHLIIIDRKSSKIVGTYRVISSTYSQQFYSQGEFAIGGMLKQPGNKLELGRACIHQDYRTGTIINLLWKGIAEYIKKTDTKFLFGCASVQTVDTAVASRLLQYLRGKNLATDEFGIHPTKKYSCELPELAATSDTEKELPALIQSYILAGAKFHGPPALDIDFQCFDFFMILKIEEMSRLFKRRYRLDDEIPAK